MPVGSITELSNEFFQNPHATYKILNDRGPVNQVEFPNGMRAWLVTDYDTAKAVLSDPTVSKDLYGPAGASAQINGNVKLRLDPPVNNNMMYADPPRHTRLRSIVMKALSGRAIEEFMPRVNEIATSLLKGLADKESVDLIGDYGLPFAITVMSELLGVPTSDRTIFQSWLSTQLSTAGVDEKYAAASNFKNYVSRLTDQRRECVGTDLLSELIHEADQGEQLSQEELVATVNALLLGSQETTASLIGNASLLILKDQRLFDDLRHDTDLIDPFLDEVLRYEGSVHMATYRFTTEAITLGSQTIDPGQILLVSLASANRDPKQFENPSKVDPFRAQNRHIAFGYGIHRCVGAALARKEVHIALSRLLEAYPEMTLDVPLQDLRWQSSVITRGLLKMPVRMGRCSLA